MCTHSPVKAPSVGSIQTLKRTSPHFQIITPDHQRATRVVDDDADACDTPKIMLGGSVTSALEFGLVSRSVPQLNDACDHELCEFDEEEPTTPRGAMLPLVAREPPALRNVSALSPNFERRAHMFDEGFVLSPMKTLGSPSEMLNTSSVWSGSSRYE